MTGFDNKGTVENASSDVKGKLERLPLILFKNGKVIFKQKCPSFEKLSETLQEIVKFREMLEQRVERGDPPLQAVPDEHQPVIAKLVHESDKTLSALAKYVYHQLIPAQEDHDEKFKSSPFASSFPMPVVEAAIKSVASRNNYGLDGAVAGKAPAAISAWRWEVKEEYINWLPKAALEKAEARRLERTQAKKELRSLFDLLPQDEKNAILGPKGLGKAPAKEASDAVAAPGAVVDLTVDDDKTASKPPSQSKQEDEENNPYASGKVGSGHRKKQAHDSEKSAKEREISEKKSVKVEKEKKEKQAQLKSQSLMANFFGKAKSNAQIPTKEPCSLSARPSSSQHEFEKTFKPFVLKKDAQLAPVNWFLEMKGKRRSPVKSGHNDCEAIVVDDGEVPIDAEDSDIHPMQEVDFHISSMNSEERLKSILSSLRSSFDASCFPRRLSRRASLHLKTHHPVTVRDVMTRLIEAEVAGDISLVRHYLSKLNNLVHFPRKVFIFHEDHRPGYFGTWTRNSSIIGPRSPLARDLAVFDYGYDSGEEWEEEGEADDVVDDGDDGEGEADEEDSDMDSFLVDDDEIEEGALDLNASPPPLDLLLPPPPPKRKTNGDDKKLGKKRKVVVPLVPFARGPCWEPAVGQCECDLFKPYRLQLFNDTPFPIDPFTFVSTPYQVEHPVPSSNTVFAVPALPERLLAQQTDSAMTNMLNRPPDLPNAPTTVPSNVPSKRAHLIPKTTFPDVHIPFLLDKITSLATGNMTFLVEAVYQELRKHNVKKNAVEVKIKEVVEKNKESRLWVVKPNIVIPPGNTNA